MPKRPLPTQADLILDRLTLEAEDEQRRRFFEVDDDVPSSPCYDPLGSPQSRRIAVETYH